MEALAVPGADLVHQQRQERPIEPEVESVYYEKNRVPLSRPLPLAIITLLGLGCWLWPNSQEYRSNYTEVRSQDEFCFDTWETSKRSEQWLWKCLEDKNPLE